MVVAAAKYEECRQKRVEENKKRMEQLNLHTLAHSIKKTTSPSKSPKPSPVKRSNGRTQQAASVPVRRSSRMTDKPPPNYKEDALEPLGRGRRVYTYNYRRRDLANRVYADPEDRLYAIDRAEKLESLLQAEESEYPCCVKPMLQSHVTGGFWLSLPLPFCQAHLPKHDEYITLVDEEGNESETKYLAGKNGLSGGWRGFAIEHELVDGDALVFQMIKPNTLKVYIIRVNSAEEEEQEGLEDGHDENNEAAQDTKVNAKKGTRKK